MFLLNWKCSHSNSVNQLGKQEFHSLRSSLYGWDHGSGCRAMNSKKNSVSII